MGLAFALLLFPLLAFGIDTPLRDPAGLLRPEPEVMARVATAKVVLADYELIQRDFPETRTLSHAEIDAWLLDHTGYISLPQAAQTKVNTAIVTTEKTTTAFRPGGYGRAAVFRAGGGLIDVKGAGALFPAQSDHRNGLATLGEALREFFYEKLIRRVLAHAGLATTTVGTYAALDYGFDVRHADGSTSRAGGVLRQAHDRPPEMNAMLDDVPAGAIEKVLRRYGLTSAGAYREDAVERINIQGTLDGRGLVDFGGYLDVPEFTKPAKNFRLLLVPGKTEFPQPDPKLRVPFEIWGYSESGHADPKLDNPWFRTHELADKLARGTATREDVENLFHRMMDPVDERLAQVPRLAAPCPDAYERLGVWRAQIH